MAALILVLIEINERIKAKKSKGVLKADGERLETKDDCQKEQSETENCSDCSLIEICEREDKKK